jgi:hypothetical protein
LIGLSLAIASVAHGWGKPSTSFSPANLKETLRLQFALQTVWIITYGLVRLSVACSLLRYGFDKSWRWPLYFIMGLQITISSSYIVIQFAQCTPISSNWESISGAKCWNIKPIVNYSWAIACMCSYEVQELLLMTTAIYITTDLILSLMPIRLIRTLNRSTSEKILISMLMALGLLATAIACAKMTTFIKFGQGDPMQGTIMPSLWAKLEEQVGIIASSLPCLKNPAEILLRKLGLLKEHQLKRPSFVADLSLPVVPKGSHEQDSDAGLGDKKDIRVDSAAVGSTSNVSTQGYRGETWQVV